MPERATRQSESSTSVREPIAIVGIGCRFPGRVNSPAEFWRLLRDGVNAITEIPEDRWDLHTFYDPEPGVAGRTYVRWGGFLEKIDEFDAGFFSISPREAASMDPQQRLLLEVSWEALEDGGQAIEKLAGSRTGVFIGISTHDYSDMHIKDVYVGNSYTNSGGALSIAANRISYALDLHGPSMAVDTACSSSLVAVHLACRSIWGGEASAAIAGGVNVILTPEPTLGFSKANMLSPDGQCKTFDAAANGYVRSEGAGAVLLKPLSQAIADGDRVYAVIRATGVNQDGHTHGLTVPSQEAQAGLLREVYGEAGIDPSEVGYVEAHGTGTPVGDPIETSAIGSVLGRHDAAAGPLPIGSVKTNIGHLEAASGMAGLIKAALILTKNEVPASLNFKEPNPRIDFDELGLRVQTHAGPLAVDDGPTVIGINSFGFGGTNAHVVLDRAPEGTEWPEGPKANESNNWPALLPLSGRSAEGLTAVASTFAALLSGQEAPELSAVAQAAANRRSKHDYRLAVVARDNSAAVESLEAFLAGTPIAGTVSGKPAGTTAPRLGFVFSGMGPQWWAMARKLIAVEGIFRDSVLECDALFRAVAGWSILEALEAEEASSRMAETEVAQPANFVVQVGLYRLWRSWGIEPAAIVGHSAGEVAACWAAGIMSLSDAVTVIYHRSRLQQRATGKGRMLAVGLSREDAVATLNGNSARVSVAATNSPRAVTLSGDADALEEIAATLDGRKVFARFVDVGVPFHSHHMEPLRDELLETLATIQPRPASIPYFSVVSGGRIEGTEVDAGYWWRNVRQPVEFATAIDRMLDEGIDAVVELAPHPVLARSVIEVAATRSATLPVLPSLRRDTDDQETLLTSLGSLYTLGAPVDWAAVNGEGADFVALPLYPWQREHYWDESEASALFRFGQYVHPLLERRIDAATPAWETKLILGRLGYLRDHVIQAAILFPASGYAEMALAAAHEILGDVPIVVEDIEIKRAAAIHPTEARSLQIAVGEDGSFQVHSRSGGTSTWTNHASGHFFRERGNPKTQGADLEALRQRASRVLDGDEFYDTIGGAGLQYGPGFQNVERVWAGDRYAVARVRGGQDGRENYRLHPAFLDSCFQTIAAALLGNLDKGQALPALLPVEIGRLRQLRSIDGDAWCYAVLTESAVDFVKADFKIFDDTGELLADIRGFKCRALPQAGHVVEGVGDAFYEMRWRQAPRNPERAAAALPTGRWMLFADDNNVAKNLAGDLEAAGNTAVLIGTAAAISVDEGHFAIPLADEEAMAKLIAAVAPEDNPPAAAVYLRGMNASAVEPGDAAKYVIDAAHFVQSLSRAGITTLPLWIVTAGAQSVAGEDPTGFAQSSLWGFGRVLINEYPHLRCNLIDLDPAGIDGGGLFAEMANSDGEREVGLRGGERFVPRVVHASAPEPAAVTEEHVPEAFYLDTAHAGSLEALVLKEARRRKPAAGEIEVKVHCAGLNFRDVMKALGLYPDEEGAPTWLGDECSGVVTRVGSGVTAFKPGDEVMGVAPASFASYVTVDAATMVMKPAGLTWEQAAAVPIVYLTTHYALNHLARMSAEDRVLIHSAAGGVGLAAVGLAKRARAQVLATAGSDGKRAYLRKLGVKQVMDSRSLDFVEETMQFTKGKGITIALNSLAGEFIPKTMSLLEPTGRFLELGKVDIYQNSKLGMAAFKSGLYFFAIDLAWVMINRRGLAHDLLQEVAAMFEAGELAPPPVTSYPIGQASEAFRFMAQAGHTGKIVFSFDETPAEVVPLPDDRPLFRKDGTYLVSGGLGGFGLEIARWLATNGAGNIVLAGRRSPAAEAVAAIIAMSAGGTNVRAVSVDVSDPAAVKTMVAEAGALQPIRGVFHAAMVIDDGYLLQLDSGRFERVFAPKVEGAWNLHEATLDCPLDYFVNFSSLAAWMGGVGQSNYAAANAYLDSFAQHRRALGLPALSVNWGVIGDVGYVARNPELGRYLSRQGMRDLSPEDATAALGMLLKSHVVTAGVGRLDPAAFASAFSGAGTRRFIELTDDLESAGPGQRKGEWLASLRAASPEEQVAALEEFLRGELAKVLGVVPERIAADQDLATLGLDSLMSMELEMALEGQLGAELPLGFFLGEQVTLHRLAVALRDQALAGEPEPAS